ncbi:MAG: LysR family transcriptional regulator [Aestuariivirgaceae bacterium]
MQTFDKLTLRAIEVFIAVIETGTVAAAATRLKASPSTVSQQISNLEATLGTKLLDRSARPIALTPAGVLLQSHAQNILDEIGLARAKLMELQLSSLPRLRLAIIDDLDATLTPDLVAELTARYPGCSFEAWSGRSDEHQAALQDRSADIIIAADIDDPEDWCERHVLLREPFVLVTAKGVLNEGCDPLQAIMKAPLVRYSARLPIGRQIEQHLRRLRLAPEHRFEFASSHSVFAMVQNCDGWALTTPLGYLHGKRFHGEIDLSPVPFAGFFRTVSLKARRNELGDLPRHLAELCRTMIEERCIDKASEAVPWLKSAMQVQRADIMPASRASAEEC